jgi:hypothetical protein
MILFGALLMADDITRTVHSPVIPFPGTALITDNSIDELQSVCATEVKMQALDWMWPGRFAFGKLGIIAGLPDEGKGQIFSHIAAMITTAGSWPCGRAPRGKVILFTAEDDIADTVVPRLASAGADLPQIHIVKMAVEAKTNKERMFSLVTDLGMLRRKIETIGDVSWC